MNGIELFDRIKTVNTLEELLQTVVGKTHTETQSKRGNLFEKTCDLIIKFGYCPILSNDMYDHYEGHIANCKMKRVVDLELYIKKQKVFSRAEGGPSDITLQNKTTKQWIFISSKFGDKLGVTDYDIGDINIAVKDKSHIYKEWLVYLFVSNKQKTLDTFNSAQEGNSCYKNNVSVILDIVDFEPYFQQFKRSIQDITIDNINSTFCNAF